MEIEGERGPEGAKSAETQGTQDTVSPQLARLPISVARMQVNAHTKPIREPVEMAMRYVG
jgi:hypothetical protein